MRLFSSTLNSLRIYTEGSVIGGPTSYGVVICNYNIIVVTCRGRLPNGCSVFQAEGAAIRAALKYLTESSTKFDSVDLLVDSQSALSSCVTPDRVTPLFSEIRALILNLPTSLQLYWVAAHRGHAGNEMADQLAKSGALSLDEPTDSLPLPAASMRFMLHESTMLFWEREWQQCSKGMLTKEFLPSTALPEHLQSTSLSGKMTQVLTGHCYLRSHLFRIKLIDSPICICGFAEETVPHVLFYCPLLEACRIDFRATVIRSSEIWPPNLRTLCKSKRIFSSLRKFVESCGRFDAALSHSQSTRI